MLFLTLPLPTITIQVSEVSVIQNEVKTISLGISKRLKLAYLNSASSTFQLIREQAGSLFLTGFYFFAYWEKIIP